MKRFLLTGSSGVLGSRVLKLLREFGPSTEVFEFKGDMNNELDIERNLAIYSNITHVINCAALVPTKFVNEFPLEAFKINCIAVGKIASLASKINPNVHFLHVSTSHVYGSQLNPIHESSELLPLSDYGKSKLSGEFLLGSIAKRNSLKFCIARVFSMYSFDQNDSFLYPSIVERSNLLEHSKEFSLFGWNNTRDFLSADEVANIIVFLSTNEAMGVVNVGSGLATTIGDFAQYVLNKKLVFKTEDRDPNPTKLVADISKLRKLGYKFPFNPLRSGNPDDN